MVALATWRAFHACRSAVLDQRPQAREPVAELDRLRDQRQARGVREVQRRRELLHRVLGHPRRPLTGQWCRVEERRAQRRRQATGPLGREGRGRVLRGDRVQVHPVHRQRQQVGLGLVGGPPRARRPRPAPRTRRGRARRVRPRCRAGCWSYEKPRPDHRQFPGQTAARIALSTRGNGRIQTLRTCGGFEAPPLALRSTSTSRMDSPQPARGRTSTGANPGTG